MGGNAINTLGYAILGVLCWQPCSGYELTQYLESVWPAKRSQIYPALTKMTERSLVVYEHVQQIGKPNKKVFSITEKGKATLKEWIATSPSETIIRDEFLIKAYAMWLLEEDASRLVQERISNLEEKMISLSEKIAVIEQNKQLDAKSKNFGRYILLSRKFRLVKEEKAWCEWVLDFIRNANQKLSLLCCVGATKFSTIIEGLTASTGV